MRDNSRNVLNIEGLSMRVLLLSMPNTPYMAYNIAILPSLALSSLAGNIDECHKVEIADLIAIRRNFKRFLEIRLTRHSPDVVGLSAKSFQAKIAHYIAKCIKQIDPKIKVVLGGYHATMATDEIVKSWGSDLDFIIRGEGETSFNKLINALDGNIDELKNINGLTYRKTGKFVHNPRGNLENLSRIKRPDRSVRLIKKGFQIFGKTADVVESSRGCFHKCKICSINEMYGQSFRTYPITRVLDDIESCKRNNVKFIGFSDDNITISPNHVRDLCDGIIERNLDDLHYFVQTSVKGLYDSPWLLKKLIDANFKSVYLGIENPSPNNLKIYGKKVKNMTEKAEVLVSKLRGYGVVVIGGFILGNPNDTGRDFSNLLQFARKLKVDLAVFNALQPYPKTPIRIFLQENDLIVNLEDYTSYDSLSINVRTNYLNKEELELLFRRLWTYFYNLEWAKWTNLRRQYPWYFLKTILTKIPEKIKDSIFLLSKAKGEQELVQERKELEMEFLNLKK